MAKKIPLTKKVEKKYYDLIAKFNRNTKTYMKKNNKKKLLELLYKHQIDSITFENKYKDSSEAIVEYAAYDIYQATWEVRRFIDDFDKMTDDQQEDYNNYVLGFNLFDHSNYKINLIENVFVSEEEIAQLKTDDFIY